MLGTLQVLLVDDNSNVRAALLRSLHSETGLALTAVGSFDEAIAVLGRAAVDVVVADYVMPGRSGADLLSVVAEQYPRVRRVLLTGSRTDVRAVQAHVLLGKPVSRETLLAAIRPVLVSGVV
jgi:DNA-binding NtrC family response regulator